jgi:hypothetical protein
MQDRCSGLWRGLAEKLLEQNLRSSALFPTKADQDQPGPRGRALFPRQTERAFPGRPGPGQTK